MTAEHNRALVERVTGYRLRTEFNDMLPPSWMSSTLELLLNAARAEGPHPTRVEENETLRDCAGHGCRILYDEGFTVQASAINRLLSLGVPQ